MNNIFKIAKNEYTGHVLTKRFWVAMLSVPLIFIFFGLLSALIAFKSVDQRPIGILDQAGIIQKAQEHPEKKGFLEFRMSFFKYNDENAAKHAVEAKTLQGYVIIPEDYLESYRLKWIGNKRLDSEFEKSLLAYISENLLIGETIPNADRIKEGSHITLETLDGKNKSDGRSWQLLIVPAILGVLYFILVMGSGSYLLQSLVGEKENRTIEILLTTVSPNEMMAGKIIGNVGVGITQLLVWVVIIGIGLLIFRGKLAFLSSIELSWSFLVVMLPFLLVSFVFTAALLAILGATMTEVQEAQAVMGVMVFPAMIPFYFIGAIMNSPNGILAKVLSYIPFSTPLTMGLRMSFVTLPVYEIALVFVIQLALAALAIWLAGKAFRVGMLEFNKRISLISLFKKEARNA